MSPTTLITGAGGYLGRLAGRALADAGHALVLVDRAFPQGFAERMARHDLRRLDAGGLAERDDLPPLDHVIHAAAVTADPAETGTAPTAYLRDHLDAALAAIDLAARHHARLVVVGSAGVFAPEQRGPLHEDVAPSGRGAYAAAKRMSEIAALEAARSGADALVVRLGNLYGGDERPGPARPRVSLVQRLVDEARATGAIALEHADEVREWTAAPDVARLLPRLLDTPLGDDRLLHLASPETLTRRDVARAVARHLAGVRVDIVSAGTPPIRGPLVSRRAVARTLVPHGGWTPFERGVAELTAALDPERSPTR